MTHLDGHFLGQEIHFYCNILCLTHKIQNCGQN